MVFCGSHISVHVEMDIWVLFCERHSVFYLLPAALRGSSRCHSSNVTDDVSLAWQVCDS